MAQAEPNRRVLRLFNTASAFMSNAASRGFPSMTAPAPPRHSPRPSAGKITPETRALLSEANDLLFMAERIEACAIYPVPGLEQWTSQITSLMALPTFGSLTSEHALERLAQELRALWLRYAQGATDGFLRSPAANQQPAVTGAGTRLVFGYERELEPQALEQRCASFTDAVPPGWAASHLLFSSGQATLSTLLQACLQMRRPSQTDPPGNGQPLRLLHVGGYFETRELLNLFEARCLTHSSLGADAQEDLPERLPETDVLLVEVAYCDGALRLLDLSALTRAWRNSPRTPALVIFDTTLSATRFPLVQLLEALGGPAAPVVACLRSALKLDQGGLELANAGICTVFVPKGADASQAALPETLRKIRRLTGASLGLQDMAALEAPWFLDPLHTARHCNAVFAHNRQLALAFRPTGSLFAGLSHPALLAEQTPWTEAPFCTLTLSDPAPENYLRLQDLLAQEAAARQLAFGIGGSFGFRGHRFEAIVPEAPESPPFLRVALGARGGPSLPGILQLLNELAACNALADFKPGSKPRSKPGFRPKRGSRHDGGGGKTR